MLFNSAQKPIRCKHLWISRYCLVAWIALLVASSQLDALQNEDKPLADEVQAAAQRFLDRIENPEPPASKKSRRKRLHKRNEQGEIVSLQLREIEFAEGDLELIGKLTHLESLDLRSSNIADKDLLLLAGLRNLRELSLEDTKIDGSGIAALSKLENLQTLSLRNTKIGDDTLKHLQIPASLSELNLRGNEITDDGLKQLKPIQSIGVLRLGDTKITDAGLLQLKDWNGLMGITLDGTAVTDAGLREFSKQEKFQWIETAEATANELVRRLENGEHANVAAMCSPGVTIPAIGKLKLATLNEVEQSDSDRERNCQRYHLEMEWTMDNGKREILFVNFSVERGTVFLHEVGISN